jgi:hypothetical protein
VAKIDSKQKKNAKISTSKFNLKVQNIYIKPLLELKNTYNKPCLKSAYLRENVKKMFKKKGAQNVTHFFGLLHLFKISL